MSEIKTVSFETVSEFVTETVEVTVEGITMSSETVVESVMSETSMNKVTMSTEVRVTVEVEMVEVVMESMRSLASMMESNWLFFKTWEGELVVREISPVSSTEYVRLSVSMDVVVGSKVVITVEHFLFYLKL